MGFHSNQVTKIEAAIDAVTTALATGVATVEYEIDGRRHRITPSDEMLERLYRVHAVATRRANATSGNGPYRVAKITRPARTSS